MEGGESRVLNGRGGKLSSILLSRLSEGKALCHLLPVSPRSTIYKDNATYLHAMFHNLP